jgi:2-polyprenyl-3-methyl-5-hydroxy-6-metoxy-1,4-benzoquinol methylase
VPWAEQDPDLFSGTEASFRPVYEAYLLKYWIPSLHVDVQKKLMEGGRVADVGCGFGASTLIMARAFRNSQFHGFDSHPASMEHAAALAASEGMEQSVHFQVARSTEFPGGPYDLITFFTCLHDMADPVAAMKRAYETLDENGSVMIVETMAGERSEDNFNPLGVIFSAVSTLCCVPNAIAGGGKAMGAVATGNVIRETATAGGFRSVHRVSQGLLNRVYEARR